MQRTLHIRLEEIDNNKAHLRYYFENPNDYKERDLDLPEIAALIQNAETDYYTVLPDDFSKIGRELYHWLDSADRFLDRAVQDARGTTEILVLAIEAKGKLAHLPWEVLHDGNLFFVQRKNPMIAPVRWIAQNSDFCAPANRPLQALFMATSPTDVLPLLDFEKEEALILEAVRKQPMTLIVEESGDIEELETLINAYPENYFDVFHLTGHGTLTDNGAFFITENDVGEAVLSSAKDLSDALIRMPRLIFLSGCHTAESAKAGATISLAQELLENGAKAVLGWGRPVSDTDASMAAAELYRLLSCGHELSKALALTYQRLIEQEVKDWHLLRLNIAGEMPGALVTPLKTPKREKSKPMSFASRFLDSQHKVKVCPREEFVGRRRALQRCLKSLRDDDSRIGVLLCGMGGIGKSTFAARLCDRLHDRQPIVWFGKIDEPALVNRLCDDLNLEKFQRDELRNPDDELKYRLRAVFENYDKPLLLVLDDFEANITIRQGQPVPSNQAKDVIEALSFAIRQSESAHRLIITCRYQFDIRESEYFYQEQLTALDKADVRKKINRLEKGMSQPVNEELKQQANIMADGNPRLLEWLFKIFAAKGLDYDKILSKMAEKATEFRENILAEELLKQQEPELKKMLALASVYELPVPQEAVEAVCKEIADLEKHLKRAAALGLIEETTLKEETLFRVSRILLPVLKEDLPEDMEGLSKVAVRTLYKLWWQDLKKSLFRDEKWIEERCFEIHRISLAGKEKEIGSQATVFLSNRLSFHRNWELISLCNKTIKIIGDDYRILHSLAKNQYIMADYKKAFQNFRQAFQNCPDQDEIEKASIIANIAGACNLCDYGIYGDILWERTSKIFNKYYEMEKKQFNIFDMIHNFEGFTIDGSINRPRLKDRRTFKYILMLLNEIIKWIDS